jgi:superfamily II DNA or RNA helicase
MNKYELFPGVYANQGQTEALDLLFTFLKSDEKAFILCGPGGTGKTTILKKAISNYPGKIGGIAISHKAKKVLGLSIGYDKVMTVAAALSIKLNEETGEFKIDEYNRRDDDKIPIKSMDLVVVDEASMISDEIIKEMKKLKKKNAKIIFLGRVNCRV